ncbi:L,D-transpeptidase [Chondromyces crocatus]|uniref:L,D-transpeptidase n=1 Tax=Chondromyces crocatus TaxID=52 RepID=UPI001FE1714E|nr:L,D-transpeptidase [Chondromyces crocatus]
MARSEGFVHASAMTSVTSPSLVSRAVHALALASLAATGCTGAEGGVGLSKGAAQGPLEVPEPAADGPKLVAVRAGAVVLERPEAGARKVGELSAGALVARSGSTYGKKGCPGGWYAVRPRGFVCNGDGVTLRVEVAPLLPAPPQVARPLPYRYGRALTAGMPAYVGVPDAAALGEAEPDLRRWQSKVSERAGMPIGAAANDVPLDERGVASGPPVLLPTAEGVGDDGKRTEGSFFGFVGGNAAAPLVPLSVVAGEVGAKVSALRKGSGVAITRSFEISEAGAGEGRRFGVTPEGRLVPADRLQAVPGSTWHGIDLEKDPLPVAFVHRYEVHAWSLAPGKATMTDDELEKRTAVPLTGRFRTVEGMRFEEARAGYWLRAQDLVVVVKRTKFPDFAQGSTRWLDVSVANQTLTAYEGQKAVYATLVSTGHDQLQDAATTASTPRGVFRVRSKHVTRGVDPREVGESFDVADAPWVMELDPAVSLTGMYWSDTVGEARTFHNVAMLPVDARRLFTWTEPQVPEGWHAVYSGEGEGTIVNIRP